MRKKKSFTFFFIVTTNLGWSVPLDIEGGLALAREVAYVGGTGARHVSGHLWQIKKGKLTFLIFSFKSFFSFST